MFRRKLQALDYPTTDGYQPDDESKFRELIVWLEDQKIRHYVVEQRTALRQTTSPTWRQALNKYLQDLELGGMVDTSTNSEISDVLLGMGIRYDYCDNVEKFSKASSDLVKAEQRQAPKIVAANPLDKLDFSSPDFISGVNTLADQLKVAKHANHLVTLEACAALVKTRYSKEAQKSGLHKQKTGNPFPFQEVDQSFDCGDYVLNHAAKILRLLFICDIRDLQTKINECIVAVQTVTANPKTDTRLGKVGF
ncbi:hypothetical protein Ocin01_07120 [Orchesella cincta]|uniref:Uncharacterized protein n=1 Tax=Orchesella cincta TaxID=48709 RepID=A0A1D2N2Q9_ORCCI|nr:hypothetical protein Ocin01_07120 [Orchesella cincta]